MNRIIIPKKPSDIIVTGVFALCSVVITGYTVYTLKKKSDAYQGALSAMIWDFSRMANSVDMMSDRYMQCTADQVRIEI